MRSKNNTYVRSEEQIRLVAQKSAETQRQRWQQKSQEEKDEWAMKCRDAQLSMSKDIKDKKAQSYRDYWNSLSQYSRDQINHKRSQSLVAMWKDNDDAKERQHQSQIETRQKQRGNLCRTTAEQSIYDYLIQIYPDLQYDIKVDNRYPYYCDFYIPSLDLFFEYQGHQSHGKLPIEFMDEEEYKNYPQSYMRTFADRDVEKKLCADKNGINLIRYYPHATLKDNILINGEENREFVELIKSIKLY